MAISTLVEIQQTQLWPQGDIRDPLGIWGSRLDVPADASGGGVKVAIVVPVLLAAAYVFTCYSALISATTGIPTDVFGKCRLLTNFPNIDPQPGIQAYGSLKVVTIQGTANFSAPFSGPAINMVDAQDRFLLLFNPGQPTQAMAIVELELGLNTDTQVYNFEAYGYYWDRSVLNAPGGPRHPGSS